MRILIAGLGAPWNLEDRAYLFRPAYGEGGGGSSLIESCVSIIPIYMGLSKLKGDLRVFVVGTDSIVDYTPSKRDDSACRKCFERAYRGEKNFKKYDSLLKEARGLYRETLNCLGLKNPFIVIAPAYGRVGERFEFHVRPRDSLSIPLLEIGLKVYGLSENGEIEDVYDDLTHGINYVATMAFQLSRMVSSLLLLAGVSPEKSFTAYNSEATRRGDKRALSIEPVYEERVGVLYYLYQLLSESRSGSSGKLIEYKGGGVPPGEFIEAASSFSKTTSKVMNIVTSIAYPFPLLLAHLVKSYGNLDNEIKDSLEKALGVWRDLTKIERGLGDDKGFHRVVHNVNLNPWLVYAYLLALFAYRRAYRILGSRDAGGGPLEFSLKALEALNRKLYSRVSPSYYHIIGNELSQIRRWAGEVGVGENWVSLEALFGQKTSSPGKQGGGDQCSSAKDVQPDVRIMIAHAGLQRQLVCVRRVDNDYMLKYIEGERTCFLEKIAGIFKGHVPSL